MNQDAERALRRWGEPVLAAAGAGFLLWTGLRWLDNGAPIGWAALIGAAVLALWLRAALASALTALRGDAPGMVILREGEIGYMGPHDGGFVPIDAIERVVIVVRDGDPGGGERFWRLEAGEAGTLAIPARARGSAQVVEALAALPGFSDLAAGRLLGTAAPGRHLVWQRDAPGALPRA